MTQAEFDSNQYGPGTGFNPGLPLPGGSNPPELVDEFEGITDTYSFGGTQVFQIDRKQWIKFTVMNEGKKRQFQSLTNRDIKINRKTEEAAFRPDAAADRHALIVTAVTDWCLYTRDNSGWRPVVFNDVNVRNWLQVTDPALVERLETAIRKANPWLNTEDATVEELQEAITELTVQLDEKRRAEAGKGV